MKGFRVYDKDVGKYVTDELYWLVDSDGALAALADGCLISFPHCVKEDETGLTDKNRRKIFEGDILKIITTIKSDWIKDENGNYKEPKRTDCAIVQEEKDTCGYKLKVYHNGKYKRIARFNITHIRCYYKAEVIGNIHDNPELLEDNDNA